MRVIAIKSTNKEEVFIYGYGEYVGEEPCEMLHGIKNPKIVLDNGKVVWGCQCWWGEAKRCEEEIIKDKKVVEVSL